MPKHTTNIDDWDAYKWVEKFPEFLVSCGVASIIDTIYNTATPPQIIERTFQIPGYPRVFSIKRAPSTGAVVIGVRKLDGTTLLGTLYSSTLFLTRGTLVCCVGDNSLIIWSENLSDSVTHRSHILATKDEYGDLVIVNGSAVYLVNLDDVKYIQGSIISRLSTSNYVGIPAMIGYPSSNFTSIHGLAPFVYKLNSADMWADIEYLTSEAGGFVWVDSSDFLYKL